MRPPVPIIRPTIIKNHELPRSTLYLFSNTSVQAPTITSATPLNWKIKGFYYNQWVSSTPPSLKLFQNNRLTRLFHRFFFFSTSNISHVDNFVDAAGKTTSKLVKSPSLQTRKMITASLWGRGGGKFVSAPSIKPSVKFPKFKEPYVCYFARYIWLSNSAILLISRGLSNTDKLISIRSEKKLVPHDTFTLTEA